MDAKLEKYFMSQHLHVKKQENIAILTINRPDRRNSLTHELFTDIYKAVSSLAQDDSVRALIVRGAGDKAFSSGFDISLLQKERPPDIEGKAEKDPMRLALQALINFPYPVIAMMNGVAFGAGYEIAVCCDIRVGADDIAVCMPPAKIGVVYSHVGLKRFISVLGMPLVKEMFFTGDVYKGALLKEKALVDYLLPRPALAPFTYDLARRISQNAPLALKGTKKILNLLQESNGLDQKQREEAEKIIVQTVESRDFKEGQNAFLEKRSPRFRGK